MLARTALYVASLAFVSQCAFAQTPPAAAFGQGLRYCSDWTTDPATDLGYKSWILGYWSGLNQMNDINHFVGRHNEGSDIWALVKARCVMRPANSLAWATIQAYKEMQLNEW